MAGPERGVYFLPEVDDEVLVAFEQGSPAAPYVLGGLWNGKDKPPESNSDGKNDRRTIKSRSGHVIRLTDTKGQEQIEITDSSGNNSIVISTKDNSVTVSASSGITIKGQEQIEITDSSGNNSIVISTKDNSVTVSASSDITIKAGGKLRCRPRRPDHQGPDRQHQLGAEGDDRIGQPAAKQGDQITATDTHIVVVPNGTATMTFPFAGQLGGRLSDDVKIIGKRPRSWAAPPTTPRRTVQPPATSFSKPPSNQGTIQSGSQTVKINGKPAARNGDPAVTCNDPVDLAVGTVKARAR